eukprot:gene4102-4348_t
MKTSKGHAEPSTGDNSTTASRAGSDAAEIKLAGSASADSKSGNLVHQPRARALGDVLLGSHSMAVRVPQDAAMKFMSMTPEDERAAQVEAQQKTLSSTGVIHPLNRVYRAWWLLTVAAACLTGWLVPFRLAYLFVSYRDFFAPVPNAYVAIEGVLTIIFAVDIVVSFLVGFYDSSGLLVMTQPAVLMHYIKHHFLLDLVTTVPIDVIVLAALNLPGDETIAGRDIALLGLLRMGRMYRLVIFFNNMSYNLGYSLVVLTMTRNLTFCVFLLHWAACAFWFIARQASFSSETWVFAKNQLLAGNSSIENYVYSLYWAIVTFATLGYGDITPQGMAEIVFTMVYISINLVVYAYILGTITLLDEEVGNYRERMAALNTYCAANNLPVGLKNTMAGLLRLHMSLSNGYLEDEQVLALYPTTIRRKILRQLYAAPLHKCYLFENCAVKFLDALLMAARVELFLPKALMSRAGPRRGGGSGRRPNRVEGRPVSETSGGGSGPRGHILQQCAQAPPAAPQRMATLERAATQTAEDALLSDNSVAAAVAAAAFARKSFTAAAKSAAGLQHSALLQAAAEQAGAVVLGPGDCFAEVSYFTEVPRTEVVRSLTVCRVLVIPRSLYHGIADDFPVSSRQVLENLKRRVEQVVSEFLPEDLAAEVKSSAHSATSVTLSLVGSSPLLPAQAAVVSAGPAAAQVPQDAVVMEIQGDGLQAAKANALSDTPKQHQCAVTASLPDLRHVSFANQTKGREADCPPKPPAAATGGLATRLRATSEIVTARPAIRAMAVAAAAAGASDTAGHFEDRQAFLSTLTAGRSFTAPGQPGASNSRLYAGPNSLSQPVQSSVLRSSTSAMSGRSFGGASKGSVSNAGTMLGSIYTDDVKAGGTDADNEIEVIQDMLSQGMPVDSRDHDGRSALMIAARNGRKEAVISLLLAGADPALTDIRGYDVMIDAAQGGHQEILNVLRLAGARTQTSKATQAFLLCKATFEGRLDLMLKLLQTGCDANAQNYDRQSALHVAAAEGNLPAAKLLVDEGKADVGLKDRWGYSPLDFAHKAGDGPLVRFLEDSATPEMAAAAAHRANKRRHQFRISLRDLSNPRVTHVTDADGQ